MDKNSIIKSVKRQEEEKVAFSLKLPASLKDQLQEISEKESVSMNSLIVAVMQSFIDDDCGTKLREATRWLVERKNLLTHDLLTVEDSIQRCPDPDDFASRDAIQLELDRINSFLKGIEI